MASRMLRPIVDIAMTVLLLLSMAYEMVGPAFEELCGRVFGVSFDGYEMGGIIHEWIGTALILLFFYHLWLNRYWLKNIFKGQYNATRAVLVLVDVLLIVDVIALLVSGVLMSKILDLPVEGCMDFARTAHMLASYWGYVIMSFHIGLHLRKLPLWVLALVAYGAYAFVKRQLGEYMFLSSEFVFFDFEEPIFYFFLDYLAIMILFACLGHYLILLFRRLKI